MVATGVQVWAKVDFNWQRWALLCVNLSLRFFFFLEAINESFSIQFIVLAISSGALTGLLLRVPIFEQVKEKEDMFDDQSSWITPS